MKLANLLFVVFYFQLQFNFYDASTKVSRLLDRLLMNYTKFNNFINKFIIKINKNIKIQ